MGVQIQCVPLNPPGCPKSHSQGGPRHLKICTLQDPMMALAIFGCMCTSLHNALKTPIRFSFLMMFSVFVKKLC